MATESQAESLLYVVKLPLPEAFKDSMDGKTILNFIYQMNYISAKYLKKNRFMQALLAVKLL